MDKFGIFNLLNSFFNFNGENKDNNFNSIDLQKGEKKDNSSLDNFISAFKTNAETPKKDKSMDSFLPIQQGMLNTMQSHDKFIERVKNKNLKKQ